MSSKDGNIEKRYLGATDIQVTPLGLGCWQFSGDKAGAFFWKTPPQDEVDSIVKASLKGGINWFDTAELYGSGRSEKTLATALSNAGTADEEIIIATKWNPILKTADSITRTIDKRRGYLEPFNIGLYQIHHPTAIANIKAQMNAMADLIEKGKIRAAGVSNFSERRMRKAHRELDERGFPLASNQVKYNLLDRRIEKNGVLDTARELKISIIAYSPLAQGLLTGKFHKNPELVDKLPFIRRMQLRRMIEKSRPLIKTLEVIADSYKRTVAEVVLAWTINYHHDSILAIPGATKTEHAFQNIGAMGLKLSGDEMKKIDRQSKEITS